MDPYGDRVKIFEMKAVAGIGGDPQGLGDNDSKAASRPRPHMAPKAR